MNNNHASDSIRPPLTKEQKNRVGKLICRAPTGGAQKPATVALQPALPLGVGQGGGVSGAAVAFCRPKVGARDLS